MKSGSMLFSAVLLGLCACSRPAGEPAANAPAVPANETSPPPAATTTTNVVTNTGATNRPPPLAEPRGPIDPKSPEAAGQVVQHYGALIEQRRFTEAEKLWGDSESARTFAAQFAGYPDLHLEIGELGEPEGAAGSIYLTEPVVFYGKQSNGTNFRKAAVVTLRRVNDVPGSTEEQRRWHIERIEWGTAR